MSAPVCEVVSLLHAHRMRLSGAHESGTHPMATSSGANAAVQHPVAYSAIVDPNDETIETEITEEMVSLALEAIENEQVWPFCREDSLVARAPRPSATIIRFPGC